MNGQYQRSLDGLRGLAILLVIMFHSDIAYFGWIGVTLFFVLSGYLITKVLLAENEKQIPLKLKFRNFWMRRVLRIFPLCYLYLLILVAGLIIELIPSNVLKELPWLFTYTYNFYLISVYENTQPSFLAGHFWSLSIEEQFYLFYPFLVFLLNSKQLRFAIVGLIIFSILFRVLVSPMGSEDIIYKFSAELDYFPFSYMDSFLCGAALFVFRFERLRPAVAFSVFILATFSLLLAGFAVYLNLQTSDTFNFLNYLSVLGIVPHYCRNYYCAWMPVCLNFFFSALLLVVLLPATYNIHKWVKGFFELRPMVAIGKVSYGMYIFHAIVIWLLLQVFDEKLINKYLFFLICLSATWLISYLVYQLYEKRFLALKEKFRSNDTKTAALAEARSSAAS